MSDSDKNDGEEKRTRRNGRAKELRESRVSAGICVNCGRNPSVKGIKICIDCNAKSRGRKRDLAKMQQRRHKRRADGLCSKCGNVREREELSKCDSCINKVRNYRKTVPKEVMRKEWIDQGKMKRKNRVANGLCQRCGQSPFREGKTTCYSCANHLKNKAFLLRSECLIKYGGACECCKEDNLCLLCIDHINNDGKKDRSTIGTGEAWYRHLVNTPKREDLRVLCHNCNVGRQHYGECPHKIFPFPKEKAVE